MKVTDAYLVVDEPAAGAIPTECLVCGFDAVFEFPTAWLADSGVATGGSLRVCVRCFAERAS